MRALVGKWVGLRADRATVTGRICGAFAAAAVIGLAGLVSVPASMAATPGLVAAYGFEEGSGTTVTDASGNGHTGTIVNANWAAAGRHGKALRFNGRSALVTVPDAAGLHLSTGLTLEAWVKPSTVTSVWRDVVYKGNDNYYLEASSQPTGYPVAGTVRRGRLRRGAYGTAALRIDRWSFLAATYDGAHVRLYVNGTQVASTARAGRIASSSKPLQIGGDSIYGHYFAGLIDDVRIYNVALTAAQLRTDQTTPVRPPGPNNQPPSQPGTLSVTMASAGAVDLAWSASTSNISVTGYQVERCIGTGCTTFAQIATSPTTTFKDTTVTANTSYSYRVRAIDAAGNLGSYSNTATATTATIPAAPPVGPKAPVGSGSLKVGPTGRYLVDQNGVPFLITGESPQALIGDLTESDAALFFANRRAHGFNTVWINLLCNDYTGCRADGSTWDGIPPFTTPGDLSTPNEAYFSRADRMIQLAAQYGFVVLLDPAETGGWLDMLVANGVDKDRAYGQYLGRRYAGFSNIIWMSGNDYRDAGPTYDPYVTAVAQGIRDVDPHDLQTVELNAPPTSGSLDDPAWAPLIDLNASYTYEPTYEQVLADYNRSNFLPTFMVEAGYESENVSGNEEARPNS